MKFVKLLKIIIVKKACANLIKKCLIKFGSCRKSTANVVKKVLKRFSVAKQIMKEAFQNSSW